MVRPWVETLIGLYFYKEAELLDLSLRKKRMTYDKCKAGYQEWLRVVRKR
jgi:hypothetical protein